MGLIGHHTLRAYAQDLRTFARFTKARQLTEPLSKDDILAYHRHLRDELGARPATIERRLVTLKSYFAWREARNSALPSPFADVRITVKIPRRLPRPIDRETLKVVLRADDGAIDARSSPGVDRAVPDAQNAVTILIIKLLIVTGLRISELMNLKVRDVSTDGGQILVNGKGSKERIVFPNEKKLRDGDIVNVDVTLILDGWHGDSSRMYSVGKPKRASERLIQVTHEAMMLGIKAVRPGARLGDIGYAIQSHAQSKGCSVVRDFCGHGIGQVFHDSPNILNFGKAVRFLRCALHRCTLN